jgi:hypothetical protein
MFANLDWVDVVMSDRVSQRQEISAWPETEPQQLNVTNVPPGATW